MSEKTERLMSIDALRGFDMFFIIGGAALISSLSAVFGCADGWIANQMRHVIWAGLAHHDTIFPLFLFLAGVSWPFSLASQEAKGISPRRIRLRVIKRTAVLFIFGLSFGGILQFKPDFRLMSVLGFIGIGWGIAALAFMRLRRVWMRIAAIGLLLGGYWALLAFCTPPGAVPGADAYSREWNIISYLDRFVYPNHILIKNGYEPESLFSVTQGAALALIGMCLGSLLKSENFSKAAKSAMLAAWTLVLLGLGAFFHLVLGDQVVKNLWTTSFILYASAYSSVMLALFYWVIDVKGFKRWAFPFMVIGVNSITIYLFMMLGTQRLLASFLFAGCSRWIGGSWGQVAMNCGSLLTGWIFVYFLYRRKIFLKV
jgi:predicted acyltransferase